MKEEEVKIGKEEAGETIDEKNKILRMLRKNKSYDFAKDGCPNCGCKYEYDIPILGQLRCGNCHEITADYSDDALDQNDIVWDEMENEFVDTAENWQTAITEEKVDAGENKEPTWVEIPGLYYLNITIDEYDGFKDVVMTIFRWGTKKVPFNPRDFVPERIPKEQLKEQPPYVLDHIKEHFTLDEIKKIQEYLSDYDPKVDIGTPIPCSIPEDGSIMPTGAIPVGGSQDFYCFYRSANYPLGDLKIAGYYDLRRHEKIDPSKPAKYMNVVKCVDKEGNDINLVINPDYEYIEKLKEKKER